MQVETSRHNIYTYLRQSNEIIANTTDMEDYVWTFEPLRPFNAMPEVDMVIISITEQCNLRCTYCCYSGKYKNNRTHSSLSMTKADIDDVYTFIKANVVKRPLRIAFYGGEPLTQYELLQYAVEKGKTLFQDDVTFSVSTNATLLTCDKVDWLVESSVKIDISIDGTASYHDAHRVDAKGVGTFSHIHKNLSYLRYTYPHYISNIRLLMTLSSVEDIANIASTWSSDDLLKDIEPASISGIAPNFACGVEIKDYETLKKTYLHLLDLYETHPDWLVLKAFFDECIAYWKDRPIVEVNEAVPMSTCLPRNTKLYIDADKNIGVCEKMSDKYRIGAITRGVDYDTANALVKKYYTKRKHRCAECPAIRMCDLCLTAVEFDESQWDMLCHNERTYVRLYMLVFCEMAERGLLSTKQVPVLYSERCTLSEVTANDISMLREIMEDAETKRFLPELYEVVKTEKGLNQFLKAFRSYLGQEEGFLWGIHLDQLLIGFIAIIDFSADTTMFYAMHPNYRHYGYMKECLSQTLFFIQENNLCKTIGTEVYRDNTSSLAVLLHNDFVEHGSYNKKIYLSKDSSII